jgi:hypothetical protein
MSTIQTIARASAILIGLSGVILLGLLWTDDLTVLVNNNEHHCGSVLAEKTPDVVATDRCNSAIRARVFMGIGMSAVGAPLSFLLWVIVGGGSGGWQRLVRGSVPQRR